MNMDPVCLYVVEQLIELTERGCRYMYRSSTECLVEFMSTSCVTGHIGSAIPCIPSQIRLMKSTHNHLDFVKHIIVLKGNNSLIFCFNQNMKQV